MFIKISDVNKSTSYKAKAGHSKAMALAAKVSDCKAKDLGFKAKAIFFGLKVKGKAELYHNLYTKIILLIGGIWAYKQSGLLQRLY